MKQYLWRAVNGHFVPFLPVISWNFIRLEWKFSSAIINYRATRTGNTKMYNNLWYLTDSIQRRNNSSLEKATPNIQATKGGNISYQRNIRKYSLSKLVEPWTFLFFSPPSDSRRIVEGVEGRWRRGRVNCENRGAPPFLSLQCNFATFERFLEIDLCPWQADAAIVRGRPVSLSIQTNWPPADRPRALSLHWTIRGAKRERNGDAPRPDARGKSGGKVVPRFLCVLWWISSSS